MRLDRPCWTSETTCTTLKIEEFQPTSDNGNTGGKMTTRIRWPMALILVVVISGTVAAEQLSVRSRLPKRNVITTNGLRTYYFGSTRISEGDFLRLAGCDDAPADEFHARNRSIVRRTFVLLGSGVAFLFTAESDGFVIAGSILASCSVLPILRRIARGNYYLTLYEARSIAEEYNAAWNEVRTGYPVAPCSVPTSPSEAVGQLNLGLPARPAGSFRLRVSDCGN